MVDDHGTWIRDRACVVHLPAQPAIAAHRWCPRVGQDLAGRGPVLRIDQVHVLAARIDVGKLSGAGGDWSILRQRQLAAALPIHKDSLRRIGGASAAILDDVEIRVTRNHDKIDG